MLQIILLWWFMFYGTEVDKGCPRIIDVDIRPMIYVLVDSLCKTKSIPKLTHHQQVYWEYEKI
jgi:hypothetical protein